MQVFHGKIITCDENNTIASYLVEKEGRIAFIGDELPAQYELVPPVELGDNVVIPAFVDTHNHYSSYAVLHKFVPIKDTDSNKAILEQLRSYAQKSREPIIVGFGASEFAVSEGYLILKEQLDEICPDKPLCLIKHDAHSGVVNSVFIDAIRNKAVTLRGYNEETGEMTQEAFRAVAEYVFKGFSTRRVIDAMVETTDFLASKGIGMFCSASGIGFIRDYDYDMEKSVAKGIDNGIQMRVAFQTNDILRSTKRDMKRVVFSNLDGTFSNQDAALIDEYSTIHNRGVSYFSDEEVQKFCIDANRAGYQIALHAVGDAAFDQATRALALALEDYPRYDHRHMILYASLPTESGLQLCGKYGILLSVTPDSTEHPTNAYSYFEKVLGEDRASRLNPFRHAIDLGVRLCFNSGAPAFDPDPISWIHNACNNRNNNQSITVYEALRAATYYGAYSCFEEKERGTLEIGKSCDLVILDSDIYSVPVENISKINVSEIYLKGKSYERSRTGAMATMLRGMFPQN